MKFEEATLESHTAKAEAHAETMVCDSWRDIQTIVEGE